MSNSVELELAWVVGCMQAGVVFADQQRVLKMATQRKSDEAEIRQRLEELVEAIRAMDIERVMPIYAPRIVSFDVEPPLQHVGAEAKRKNWLHAFSMYQRPLGYEMRDLEITVGDEVAFGHAFVGVSGTLKNGDKTQHWLRSTVCFRKIADTWLIVHDQVSVPIDYAGGRALLNLQP